MKVETKTTVERANAVLNPHEVEQAILDYIGKHHPGPSGWLAFPGSVEMNEEGGAIVKLERRRPAGKQETS